MNRRRGKIARIEKVEPRNNEATPMRPSRGYTLQSSLETHQRLFNVGKKVPTSTGSEKGGENGDKAIAKIRALLKTNVVVLS